MSESALDKYTAGLQNPEPGHYTRMPNVLYLATYLEEQKDGTLVRKKLSPRFRDLYHFIKMIASTGTCWMTGENIADQIGCSAGTISALKKEGLMPIEQLDNKPLFTIHSKKKRVTKSDGTKQSVLHHKIVVNDIWKESNAFMACREELEGTYPIGTVHNSDPSSNIEGGYPPSSNIEDGSPGTSSNIEGNNRNTEEDEICTEEDEVANATEGCSYLEKISVKGISEIAKTQTEKAVLEMRCFGFDDNFIREMLKRRLPPNQILNGIFYAREQHRRGKVRSNLHGYGRTCIEQGRVWHNTKT